MSLLNEPRSGRCRTAPTRGGRITQPELAAVWKAVLRYAKTTGTFWLVKEHVLIPPPVSGPNILRPTPEE